MAALKKNSESGSAVGKKVLSCDGGPRGLRPMRGGPGASDRREKLIVWGASAGGIRRLCRWPWAAACRPCPSPRDSSSAREGPRRISPSRRSAAASRHRGDSSPGMVAGGGFFLDSEPFRTASGAVSGATGETSRTAPASGHRRLYVAVVRPPTPARHRRAPRRLEPPRGPRAVSRRPRTGVVGVIACVALGRRGA